VRSAAGTSARSRHPWINDDGILAPGLTVLAEAVSAYGDVVVSAPDSERSASSHAITLNGHLRSHQIRTGWYAVTGTPVDSVYLGALHLCPRLPDLVVAGINPGYNLGTDVIYSGTVGAAREGRLRGASAIAFSVRAGVDARAAVAAIDRIVPVVLERHERGERHLLNVNVPTPRDDGRVRVVGTHLGKRLYRDHVDQRHDPQGRPYFWIGGPPITGPEERGGDGWAVQRGDISVTPLGLDPTAADADAWRSVFDAPTED
jgi:5'-nucleotidase